MGCILRMSRIEFYFALNLKEMRCMMMKKKALLRRLAALALTAVVALPFTACGNTDTSGIVEQKEFIYVPEFKTLEEENASYYDMELSGNNLYYMTWAYDEESGSSSQTMRSYSLADGQSTDVTLKWPDGEDQSSSNQFLVGADGSIYMVLYNYRLIPGSQEDYERSFALCKFDAQGNQVFSKDLSKQMEEEEVYLRSMAVDDQGRIYLCVETAVWLYDAAGEYQGSISLEEVTDGWVNGMGTGKDGKVYINCYSRDASSGGYSLIELDFDNKKTGAVYADFPSTNSDKLIRGIEKDFLVYDSTSVYEYDLATQTKEPLFDWLDSDINGSYVESVGVLEDGRFVAVYQDWETNDSGIALLTKTKSDQVAQKETVVIAALSSGSDLRAAVVKFNKASSEYHITVKDYLNYDNIGADGDYESVLKDALTSLNNDLTSRNAPDILDLDGLNVKQLAAKGVFADLNEYLDKSTVLNRSDILENVLDAYTYDDVLVSIPCSIFFQTLVASKADLGDKQGWTMDEMIAYADAHPDAELFDGAEKRDLLQYLMMYNEDTFIDWKTGECNFDSEEFKSLLKFVNRLPDEVNRDYSGPSTPTRIQNGEVLLDTLYLSEFNDIQIPIEEFKGEAVMIGFPTLDGSSGHAMVGSQTYAIISKSKNKDAAWAFLESILARDDSNDRYRYGFPVMKSKLDAMAKDAVTPKYVLDEDGQPWLDEDGNPIIENGTSSIGYEDGWSYTYHLPTQEEVDMVLAIMKTAKPISYDYNSEVISIIQEEAEPFFKNQKSVDEVAGIIQSRIKIYVSEMQ